MSEITVVYPTSANPPTWGHADIMYRAAVKFDKIYWVAACNPHKVLDFSVEQRLRMMQAYVDYYQLKNVIVDSYSGTIVRYALDKNASFLLRGLRNTSDFQAELELASGNRGISKDIETICFFAKPHFATISSRLIRELARLGEKIDQYVLPTLTSEIRTTLNKETKGSSS
ncbi:MAG: pantetheine-phosphate adenylyltransferase [Oligoflexia bacterium]|nr:pantetheine-phosphate adenylyltransferase [Oligoflexia bacterium]MBF0366089.1 pantetheine-phosphate adenylyltransferase [Oligoflexia bacterium]